MKEDCKKNFERISEYLDGELGPDDCQQIEQHLEECPECRDCFDALKKTIDLCKKNAQEEIPGDMQNRLKSKLRECFGNN
ncbi:MAG: zf-HC2 domain-containing protein [Deltaproteobacteria bacterium]|nr:zf-HC2 domain-containing protein [Deltaproteobacteria bacterium]